MEPTVVHMIGYGNSKIPTNFIASGLEAKHENILQKRLPYLVT